MVHKQLKIKLTDGNVGSPVQNFFKAYHTILRRSDLIWLLIAKQNISFYYVLSSIKSVPLLTRLSTNLSFAHYELEKHFKAFKAHALRVSECFHLVDSRQNTSLESMNTMARRKWQQDYQWQREEIGQIWGAQASAARSPLCNVQIYWKTSLAE